MEGRGEDLNTRTRVARGLFQSELGFLVFILCLKRSVHPNSKHLIRNYTIVLTKEGRERRILNASVEAPSTRQEEPLISAKDQSKSQIRAPDQVDTDHCQTDTIRDSHGHEGIAEDLNKCIVFYESSSLLSADSGWCLDSRFAFRCCFRSSAGE